RDVDCFGVEALSERQILERLPTRGNGGGDTLLESVDARSLPLALIGRHRAERLEQRGHRAVATERGNADGLEHGLVRGGGDCGEKLGLEGAKVGHGLAQLRQRRVLGSSGLTKGRASACAAIHSSLIRIHQRAWVSASLINMSRGLCTRPSRCFTTTWRS